MSSEQKGMSLLAVLVYGNNPVLVEGVLAKGGFDVHERIYANDARTLLMTAASRGYADVVKVLISYGAEVNARSDKGYTALMLASLDGFYEVVETLIEHGAFLNARNYMGRTALMLASLKCHTDIISFLCDHGDDIKICDNKGLSPLHLAFKYEIADIASSMKCIAELLGRGADVDWQEREHGATVLHTAAMAGNADLVNLLLEYGADVSLTTKRGLTAGKTAEIKGHYDIADLLSIEED